MAIHTSATGGSSPTWRDCAGVLHGHKQERRRHHWGGNVFRDAGAGRTLLQQDSVFLLRGAEVELWRDGGYAGVLLH